MCRNRHHDLVLVEVDRAKQLEDTEQSADQQQPDGQSKGQWKFQAEFQEDRSFLRSKVSSPNIGAGLFKVIYKSYRSLNAVLYLS